MGNCIWIAEKRTHYVKFRFEHLPGIGPVTATYLRDSYLQGIGRIIEPYDLWAVYELYCGDLEKFRELMHKVLPGLQRCHIINCVQYLDKISCKINDQKIIKTLSIAIRRGPEDAIREEGFKSTMTYIYANLNEDWKGEYYDKYLIHKYASKIITKLLIDEYKEIHGPNILFYL